MVEKINTHKVVLMKENQLKVVQSNELTEAAYYLPLQAKRLLWLCLRQRYMKSEAINENPLFHISVGEYADTFHVSTPTASRDMKYAVETISEKAVTFHLHNDDYEIVKRPWLAEAGAKKGWGEWSIEFNQKIMPYITGLSSNFTTYSLYDCGKLKSVRVIRLYECLCQYRSTGIFKTTHEWLVDRFHLPESQRQNRAELKRTFIEPAVKNINKSTQIKVNYKEEEDGSFTFHFIDNTTKINLS